MAINQIEGTENNDFITDTILDDEIFAFGGDDEIEVSSGNDTVDGGEGKDRLVANYSSRTEDLQFSFNSSGYFDWNNNYSMNGSIDVSSVFGNYFSVLNFNNIEDFAFTSGSGNDNIDLGYDNYSDDKIDAGAGMTISTQAWATIPSMVVLALMSYSLTTIPVLMRLLVSFPIAIAVNIAMAIIQSTLVISKPLTLLVQTTMMS